MNRTENIDYCIRYLAEQEKVAVDIPTALADKQRLLRALMNVWHPAPLSADYLQAQDRELQWQQNDKGVVEPPMQEPISLWQGDITRLRVDAIVNAANNGMLGCWAPLHGCIDNAIHSAAGLQLRQECARQVQQGLWNPAQDGTGKAIITPAYNLPCRYVLHTVGPIIADGQPTPAQEEQLASCYRACLQLAQGQGLRSVAFCCISTGEFHFPPRRAAEIAVHTVRNCQAAGSVEHIIFNVFKDTDYDIYRTLI